MTLDPSLLPFADKIIILVLIIFVFLLGRDQRVASFPVVPPVVPPILPPIIPPDKPPIDPGKPPVDPGKPPVVGAGPVHVWKGKCSEFGGPNDFGSGNPNEGLALVGAADIPNFQDVLLPGAHGDALFRQLNPASHYIACRFDYTETPKTYLQKIHIIVKNPANGKIATDVRAVDWGPNANTGRVADLSPGLAAHLGLITDNIVEVNIPLPAGGPAPGTPVAGEAPWLGVMTQITGTHEVAGSGDNPVILSWATAIGNKFPDMADYCARYNHDTIAWCGLTVAYCMAMSGIRPQFGPSDTDKFLWADAWRQFGTAVTDPKPGDVLIFQWASGGHHVTLYDHETEGDQYACRGGNQSDTVNVTMFPMSACIAIRRPAP